MEAEVRGTKTSEDLDSSEAALRLRRAWLSGERGWQGPLPQFRQKGGGDRRPSRRSAGLGRRVARTRTRSVGRAGGALEAESAVLRLRGSPRIGAASAVKRRKPAAAQVGAATRDQPSRPRVSSACPVRPRRPLRCCLAGRRARTVAWAAQA